jgi:hypothetical protein
MARWNSDEDGVCGMALERRFYGWFLYGSLLHTCLYIGGFGVHCLASSLAMLSFFFLFFFFSLGPSPQGCLCIIYRTLQGGNGDGAKTLRSVRHASPLVYQLFSADSFRRTMPSCVVVVSVLLCWQVPPKRP